MISMWAFFKKLIYKKIFSVLFKIIKKYFYLLFKITQEGVVYDRATKLFFKNSFDRNKFEINKKQHIKDFFDYYSGKKEILKPEMLSFYKVYQDELEKDLETSLILKKLLTKKRDGEAIEVKHKLQGVDSRLRNIPLVEVFTPVSDYIERVCSLENDDIFGLWYHNSYEPNTLIDYMLGGIDSSHNKYILYAEAQCGKTTELKNLVYEIQNTNDFIPILYNIKVCDDLKLPDFSPEEEGNYVIIVDALDEQFNHDKRNTLFHYLNDYALKYKHLRMVVSCRSNFRREDSLKGFTVLNLHGLSTDRINQFIRNNIGTNSKRLIDLLETNTHFIDWYSYICNPFYLFSLIKYYNDKKTLPASKAVLYDYFINENLLGEQTSDLDENKDSYTTIVRKYLMQVALWMQLKEVDSISESKLLDLLDISDPSNKRLLYLKRSRLLGLNKDNQYAFEHEAFKEYFVSQCLKSIHTIKEIQFLSCYSNGLHIKKNWYNTIALFISHLEKDHSLYNEVIDWICDKNVELLSYIEVSHLDERQKEDSFIAILNYCKETYSFLTEEQSRVLMRLCVSTKTINDVITQLKSEFDITIHGNLLRSLKYFDWSYFECLDKDLTKQLQQLLFDLLANHYEEIDNAFFIFEPFKNNYFYKKATVEHIYSLIHTSNHPDIINNMLYLITKTSLANEYIDYITAKSKYIINDHIGSTINIVSDYQLKEAYLKIDSYDSIIKSFTYIFSVYIENWSERKKVEWYVEILSSLFEHAKKYVESKSELKELILNGFFDYVAKTYYHSYNLKDIGELFIQFIETSGLKSLVVDKICEDINILVKGEEFRKYGKVNELANAFSFFATTTLIDQLFQQYTNTSNGYYFMFFLKKYTNEEIGDYIASHLQDYFRDFYQEEKIENIPNHEIELNDLFNYEVFKEQVLYFAQDIAPLSWSDFRKKRRSGIISKYINNYVVYFCNQYEDKEQGYSFDRVIIDIQNREVYNYFVIKYTQRFLYSDKDQLKEEHRQILFRLAQDELNKMLLEKYPFYRNYRYISLEVLLRKDIAIQSNQLIDLLPYSFYFIEIKNEFGIENDKYFLFDYIIDHFEGDRQLLNNKLVELLSENKFDKDEFLKVSLTKYILNNNLGLSYILNWIYNCEYYSSVEQKIIDELIERDRMTILIKSEIEKNRLSVSTQLFTFERMLNKDNSNNNYIEKHLVPYYRHYELNNKIGAIRLLLSMGNLDVLDYVCQFPNILARHDLSNINYSNIEALNNLILLLKEYPNDSEGHFITGSILNSIGKIAVASESNFKQVENECDKLINEDKVLFSFLLRSLKQWKHDLWAKKTYEFTDSELKGIVSSIIT